jgi:hypothetical protein
MAIGTRDKQLDRKKCKGTGTVAPTLDPKPFATSFYNHIWSEEKAI